MNATQTFFVALVTILIAGIPPTILAWANLQQSKKNTTKTEAVSYKTDVIIEKAAEIHTLTNSNLSKVTADLALALNRIEDLEKVIKLQQEKSK